MVKENLQNIQALDVLRHSTAHLLAMAVKRIFPDAKLAIGPVIENGFYYDFELSKTLDESDLSTIKNEMHNLSKAAININRRELSYDEAYSLFTELDEPYKLELLQGINKNEVISVYIQSDGKGCDFIDLCRGPHVENTNLLKVFDLTSISGAYWRGNSNNKMLQRVYGTAWFEEKDLIDYKEKLKEAEKRDHRKIGKVMRLFNLHEESPGMIFWLENGLIIYRVVENYIRNLIRDNGYLEVKTPQILDIALWEKSGHLQAFSDQMFKTNYENRHFAIKPMNCPCHILIFKQSHYSYNDLPIRFAEFGVCHRCEPSGSLHGLMRVRAFEQDDAHIFCTNEQIESEVRNFVKLLFLVYEKFGFEEVLIKVSTRPENRLGEEANWDIAENALKKALDDLELVWELQVGEGAFYGPKIEFSLKDCIGRIWQCGTLQLDFVMPERFGIKYTDSNNERKTPVMLHRAILGTLERFIGILIEHYAGKMPFWLAPVQVVILPISVKHHKYAHEVYNELFKLGCRAKLDSRNEKLGYKMRDHIMTCVNYLLIIGDKEVDSRTVSLKILNSEENIVMNVKELIAYFRGKID